MTNSDEAKSAPGLSAPNDPLAAEIESDYLAIDDSPELVYELLEVARQRYEFKATQSNKSILVALCLGGFFLAFGLTCLYNDSGTFDLKGRGTLSGLFFVAVGILSAAAWLADYLILKYPIVFDLNSGYFWKGWKSPREKKDYKDSDRFVELDEIHALQITSKSCSDQKLGEYYSYEINLVLNNGKRVNVVYNGKLSKLREDAHTLAKLLDKPIWDMACL